MFSLKVALSRSNQPILIKKLYLLNQTFRYSFKTQEDSWTRVFNNYPLVANHDSHKIGNDISDTQTFPSFVVFKKPDRSKGSVRSKKRWNRTMFPAGNYIDTMSFVVAIVFLGQQLYVVTHVSWRNPDSLFMVKKRARRPLRRPLRFRLFLERWKTRCCSN